MTEETNQNPDISSVLEETGVTTYLEIKSTGEIEPESFRLIGASTKRDDNQSIGIFGSGLKYSIAYLLRQGIDFKVYSGTRKVTFDTKESEFRGKVFEQIVIDGEPTSFTTDLGYDWEMWYAIREIYCNALDEGESSCKQVASIEPEEGETTFYIEVTSGVREMLNNWNLYFSEGRNDLLYQDRNMKVFEGGKALIIYRKGIRCYYNDSIASAFHYDMNNIKINESRTLVDVFTAKMKIGETIARMRNTQVLKKFLRAIHAEREIFEFQCHWHMQDGEFKSREGNWEEAIGNYPIVEYEIAGNHEDEIAKRNPWILPKELCDYLLKYFENIKHVGIRDIGDVKIVEGMDAYEENVLSKAKEFLNECEFPLKYPIEIAEFKNRETKGACAEGTIYVGRSALEDLKTTVKVLIEETTHLDTGYDDCTRELQNYYLDMFLKEKCKRFAYTL